MKGNEQQFATEMVCLQDQPPFVHAIGLIPHKPFLLAMMHA